MLLVHDLLLLIELCMPPRFRQRPLVASDDWQSVLWVISRIWLAQQHLRYPTPSGSLGAERSSMRRPKTGVHALI